MWPAIEKGPGQALAYDQLCQTWDPWRAIPAHYNLGAALAQGPADKPALLWENAKGRTAAFSYGQLDALTNRLASSLKRLGLRRGERVLLRLPNVPEFYTSALAVAKLGGVFIPTSTQFKESELRYRLKDSQTAAVVTTPRLLDAIDRVRGDCPDLRHVIVVPDEPGQEVPRDALSSERLIGDGKE